MFSLATSRTFSSALSKNATSMLHSGLRLFSKERAGKSIRPGCAIILDNQPHRCSKIIQGKRGKGGGFIKATLKNLITGNSYEKTFTSDEMVEHADLERKPVSYSWADDLNYIFMDLETFEEVILPQTEVELGHFLVAGQEVCSTHHQSVCTTFISLYVHFICPK
jgi:translation elongation factor P/translation initiation factor 5A